MPSDNMDQPLPRDADALTDLHHAIAATAADSVANFVDACATLFGKDAANAASEKLMPDGHDTTDFVDLTQPYREAAEYAGQGIAPRERHDEPVSLASRQARVQTLAASADAFERCSTLLVPGFGYTWRGVKAREAIDFGGAVSLEGLQMLSGLSQAVMRNAVSTGDLRPDATGNVSAEEAREWLARRREFCPSRWKNPADDQWPFDPSKVAAANEKGMISVPQAADGDAFTPDRVVRPARSAAGISIMVGPKGNETQYRDFYAALVALAKMDVPRWRRRNSVGNWGIVRARGAWAKVSQAEIDRQLAEKLLEAS